MKTETAEEYAAHSEVDPEGVYSEVDAEAAPRPTVIGEIRGTLRQLKRLQGVKGEGFTDAVLRGLALQLHISFDVRFPSDGLMRTSPD